MGSVAVPKGPQEKARCSKRERPLIEGGLSCRGSRTMPTPPGSASSLEKVRVDAHPQLWALEECRGSADPSCGMALHSPPVCSCHPPYPPPCQGDQRHVHLMQGEIKAPGRSVPGTKPQNELAALSFLSPTTPRLSWGLSECLQLKGAKRATPISQQVHLTAGPTAYSLLMSNPCGLGQTLVPASSIPSTQVLPSLWFVA